MIRGTTPVLEFELPFDTELIAEAYVTISQNQKAVFEKNFAECIHSGKLLKVNLSQEDTLKLESCCNSHAEIQVQSLTDEQALTVKDIYPVWDGNGVSYQKDFYLTHNGKLYKVLQAHTSQSDWVRMRHRHSLQRCSRDRTVLGLERGHSRDLQIRIWPETG